MQELLALAASGTGEDEVVEEFKRLRREREMKKHRKYAGQAEFLTPEPSSYPGAYQLLFVRCALNPRLGAF